MPQADLTLEETISTLLPSAANVFAVCGVCSEGDPAQEYTFDPGASAGDVRDSLGDGKLTEAVVTLLRYGRRRVVAFPVASSVDGTISAVTKVRPSNPLAVITPTFTIASIAASGDVLEPGPYDSLHIALEISAANKFRYYLDHQTEDGELVGTPSGDIDIPSAKAAVLVGTVDLSTITVGDLDTLTFIIDTDSDGGAAVTTTFAAPATINDIVTQINANNGGGVKYLVALVGANKLAVYSITTGGSGTVAIGNGTANTLLGFTNGQSATGTAATYDIPNTGLRITASASPASYTVDDYYHFTTKGPKVAAGDLAALFTRIHAKIAAGEAIGAVWVVQDDADAIDARTMLDALSTQLTASRTAKYFLWGLYQLPSDASDADVLSYCGDFADPYVAVSAGGFRAYGGALTGSRFTRPASWVGAWKAARDRFSSDLGNREDRALTTAFGVTELSRDERTASTKLATFRTPQTGDGGGFLVLETPSNSVGEAYFYRGRTMASFGSILGDLGSTRLLLVCGRQLQRTLDLLINSDPPVRADGSLVDVDSIKSAQEEPLRAVLFDDPEAPRGHASNLSISDPTYSAALKTASISFEVQRNAQVKKVSAKLGVVDTLSVSEVV